MLHSVGCAQPDAMAFVQSWNQPGVKACVHGFIDANTGAVYQTLPWTCRGWHGGGSSNNTHIGVEMCEPASIRYTSGANFLDQDPAATEAAVLRTYGTAVDLFAQLCRTFSLDPLGDGVILSHREGHQRGIATNHGDPEHLWSPFGLTMDIFRQAVSAALTGQAAAPASPAVPFLGRVTADALHIRSGPGTNCPIVGTIRDQGVYTIVETADGQGASQWGKLKSGAGGLPWTMSPPNNPPGRAPALFPPKLFSNFLPRPVYFSAPFASFSGETSTNRLGIHLPGNSRRGLEFKK